MVHIWYSSQYLQQHPRSTPLKNNRTQRHQAQHIKSLHLLAGIVVAAILLQSVYSRHTAVASAKKLRHKEGFCIPPVHKITLNMCKTERPLSSITYRHCLRHNPYLKRLWKTIGQPPLTLTRHVAQNTSGDCVRIIEELLPTIKIEDKTASGKIYIADSRHNLVGLHFIESLDLLDISLISVYNTLSWSPAQSGDTEKTNDIIKRFSPVFTDDLERCTQPEATMTLKQSATPVFLSKWPKQL